jgi:hypothetical protein
VPAGHGRISANSLEDSIALGDGAVVAAAWTDINGIVIAIIVNIKKTDIIFFIIPPIQIILFAL